MGVSSNQGCNFGEIMILVYWGSYWGRLILGNYQTLLRFGGTFPRVKSPSLLFIGSRSQATGGGLMYHPYFSLPPGTAQCDG